MQQALVLSRRLKNAKCRLFLQENRVTTLFVCYLNKLFANLSQPVFCAFYSFCINWFPAGAAHFSTSFYTTWQAIAKKKNPGVSPTHNSSRLYFLHVNVWFEKKPILFSEGFFICMIMSIFFIIKKSSSFQCQLTVFYISIVYVFKIFFLQKNHVKSILLWDVFLGQVCNNIPCIL